MKKKYLITGGTGFIGGRLIEQLLVNHQSSVTTILRNFTNAARIARFDTVEMQRVLFDEYDKIDSLVEKHDYVIHLAYDSSSQKNNLLAIDSLAKSCIKYNKRLIHISTISVYEPLIDLEINEDSISEKVGIRYADRKLEIEQKVFKYINEGLQAVILQPTIVYGPFSNPWTDRPANQLINGTVILPDGGQGLCNPVYVDDVCKSIMLSCEKNEACGKRFLISGPEIITWDIFFKAFEKYLKVDSINYMNLNEIKNISRNPIKFFKIILGNPMKAVDWEPMKSFLMSLQYKLPSTFKAKLKLIFQKYKGIAPNPIYIPNKEILDLYISQSRVSIEKAKKILNYNPDYDFNKGMQLTGQYLEWAYIKKYNLD